MDFGKLRGVLAEGDNKFLFVAPSPSGEITLSDAQSKMSVSLAGMPARSLAIKVPQSQEAFLRGEYGKTCDYFVIVPRDGGADVVLCEMKTTLSNGALVNACRQIKCSIPLLCYIKAALKTHFGDDGKIHKHYAVIAERGGANIASMSATHGGKSVTPYVHEKRKVNIIINPGRVPLHRLFSHAGRP